MVTIGGRPILYRFQDITRYWPKIANFPTQPQLILAEGVSLELGRSGWAQETRVTIIPGREKSLMMSSHFGDEDGGQMDTGRLLILR